MNSPIIWWSSWLLAQITSNMLSLWYKTLTYICGWTAESLKVFQVKPVELETPPPTSPPTEDLDAKLTKTWIIPPTAPIATDALPSCPALERYSKAYYMQAISTFCEEYRERGMPRLAELVSYCKQAPSTLLREPCGFNMGHPPADVAQYNAEVHEHNSVVIDDVMRSLWKGADSLVVKRIIQEEDKLLKRYFLDEGITGVRDGVCVQDVVYEEVQKEPASNEQAPSDHGPVVSGVWGSLTGVSSVATKTLGFSLWMGQTSKDLPGPQPHLIAERVFAGEKVIENVASIPGDWID